MIDLDPCDLVTRMQRANVPSSEPAGEPSVHVIVITCNGRRHLEGCFTSLEKTAYPNYAVWLVDNASSDGSAEYVVEHFPHVRILRNEENLGFARGNNLAMIRALDAGADYIFLLNDDTVLLDERWLAAAVELAERERAVGMIGFDLLDTPVLPAGGRPATITSTPVDRIDGCALFMRAPLLRGIGLLDEAYFAYAEEDDLETRAARAGAQFRTVHLPIYHFGGGTSKRFRYMASYLQMRNGIRHSIKHRPVWRTLLRIGRTFDVACNPFPLFLDRDNQAHLRVRGHRSLIVNFGLFLAAVGWNVLRLTSTLRIRREERRRIADYMRSTARRQETPGTA